MQTTVFIVANIKVNFFLLSEKITFILFFRFFSFLSLDYIIKVETTSILVIIFLQYIMDSITISHCAKIVILQISNLKNELIQKKSVNLPSVVKFVDPISES
jgi:hypothetical protein